LDEKIKLFGESRVVASHKQRDLLVDEVPFLLKFSRGLKFIRMEGFLG
jgi:hypothetical protein